ncbi:hypothetical protein KRP22_015156 [Phytophthora ramorum]|nr:hypothetical protein KRP22_15089 [Phytophthora ramorum]
MSHVCDANQSDDEQFFVTEILALLDFDDDSWPAPNSPDEPLGCVRKPKLKKLRPHPDTVTEVKSKKTAAATLSDKEPGVQHVGHQDATSFQLGLQSPGVVEYTSFPTLILYANRSAAGLRAMQLLDVVFPSPLLAAGCNVYFPLR